MITDKHSEYEIIIVFRDKNVYVNTHQLHATFTLSLPKYTQDRRCVVQPKQSMYIPTSDQLAPITAIRYSIVRGSDRCLVLYSLCAVTHRAPYRSLFTTMQLTLHIFTAQFHKGRSGEFILNCLQNKITKL
jgi:hypothetical protein